MLSSAQLAEAVAPELAQRLAQQPGEPAPLIVIHQEYEYGSTLGFYLQRPRYNFAGLLGRPPIRPGQPALGPPTAAELARVDLQPIAVNPIHILTDAEANGVANYGHSSNLWYGSFFPDAPAIFETPQSLAAKWSGPQRIFLWQDLANQPRKALPKEDLGQWLNAWHLLGEPVRQPDKTNSAQPKEDREWVDAPRVGRELI